MRILYICGTYAPGAFAGSEISAHQLLKELNADPDIEILVATDHRYTSFKTISSNYDGVILQGIQHEQRRPQLQEVILEFDPDVIFTQLLWSDVALELGESQGVPTVLRIPTKSKYMDIYKATALVANSRYICDYITKHHGLHCHYIFSTIDLDRVMVPPAQRNPRFITMFNPIRKKGGHIFKEIAKSMPDKDFAVVPGWHSLRTPDGSWDMKVINAGLESQNVGYRSWVPKDIKFEEIPNVHVLEPTEEVMKIFALTRLLLVPSQYEETLARVSIEAYANGIPVIGSQVGGLQEHVRKAGYLIKDYSNPNAWIRAIKLMDDGKTYKNYSNKALQFIKNDFSNSSVKDDFKSLFSEVLIAKSHDKKMFINKNSVKYKADKTANICIVMPYFGSWPEWMELYLESCKKNPFIEWLFFTDCKELKGLPPNVHMRFLTLEQFLQKVENKLEINIEWKNPYKICDLRPAFGRIFESEIDGYQHYGWGDLDVIYGDMEQFLTGELLKHDCISFSKNHLSGHLCLWKNRPQIREWYKHLPNWKENMESPEYTHFDEISPSLIPHEFSVHAEYSFNTPLSQITPWIDGTYNYPDEWYWKDGKLTNNKDGGREFLYLHFMHWKGGWWPRFCGNAQWEKLEKLVHLKSGDSAKGFRINEFGFFPIEKGTDKACSSNSTRGFLLRRLLFRIKLLLFKTF